MRLGEKIGQYRRSLGISQEELGARLGVSRQAVSKWETGAATPDMANLIALAREFGISVAELTETPEPQKYETPAEASEPQNQSRPSHENLRLFLFPVFIALLTLVLFAAGAILWTKLWPDTSPSAAPPPDTPLPETEFCLYWHVYTGEGSHSRESLTLGPQESGFPFGASLELSAPEEVCGTDFSSMTHQKAVCGGVTVEYNHIEKTEGTWDTITSLSTLQADYATPRGIVPGETKDDLLLAYDSSLVYCLKEEGGYTLVPHEYFYAYSVFEDTLGWGAILFYMKDGLVAGIRMEALGELGDFYAPDNISRFPIKDGEPDFSLREEPEREALSDTRRVYIAFNQLVTNNNLTAEEQYAYRRDIFTLLPDMDWSELMQMGTAEYPDDTFFALLNWLEGQDNYTASEIFHIQWGCTAKGLDGAYTDAYCQLLSHVLFYDPVGFAKNLALEGPAEEEKLQILRHTAYDAEWHPVELETALKTLDGALNGGHFTEAETGWARLLRLYLTTPIEERNDLPKSPSELP